MIHTDGEDTIANRPFTIPGPRPNDTPDEDWRTRIERDLLTLDRAERERVYVACRESTDNVFDWLACLDGATS